MPPTVSIDLGQLSQALGIAASQVRAVVDLLDAGNTVPFITRYRKDQTGGLDEEQIRLVQERVLKLRLLAERKQTILRSIETQGKATPELTAQIEAADTMKRLEDLYLPYKPKKQTLATLARSRGLEPLAKEILAADPLANHLDARAADFINPDRKVTNLADVLLGVGHILAEMFSERADLRGRLRMILEQTGRLVSVKAEGDSRSENHAATPKQPDQKPVAESESSAEAAHAAAAPAALVAPAGEVERVVQEAAEATDDSSEEHPLSLPSPAGGEGLTPDRPPSDQPPSDQHASDQHVSGGVELSTVDATSSTEGETSSAQPPTPSADHCSVAPVASVKSTSKPPRPERKKKDKKETKDDGRAFRDYFDYREALANVPPHRVLAINRGERAKILRVKVDADLEAMQRTVDEMLVPPEHPHADFLRGCGRDALARLVFPGLEREVRRELTDRAEAHAVEVFARNLRNLLLQSPVRDRRVLAVDPGFKSGCKLAALDEFGNMLDHGVVHLVGKEERRAEAKSKLVEMVRSHRLSVIAIGNGTACRETEQWIGDLIASDLAEEGAAYVIVNEAGASVYSTSRVGREEFPSYDATLRGAISIGRRLQDPLSELVKIDAANIGVGMYQHDVKAKHLRDSLDSVVESCVNYVGVDLNTASPALLRYVSGLNQLTAQRVFSYRQANGPFKNRAQLKAVPGFGEATFVQAAGFLQVTGGDDPLDATWIHPESYAAAQQVLEQLGLRVADLADKSQSAALAERLAAVNVAELAGKLNVGALTLADIVSQLVRPGRDPRESLPQPIFKRGVLKLDDLTPGMELLGTVLNVVDFGAFVDIGLKDSGLVHISQLADKFVQDPHDVVSVGDIVKVWVLSVDRERRRVSLTMYDPTARKAAQEQRAAQQRRAAQERRPTRTDQPAVAVQGRPPRPVGARPQGRREAHGKPVDRKPKPSARPAAKPRPLIPLSKAMAEGDEPMRTFGDLKQFFELKKKSDSDAEQPN